MLATRHACGAIWLLCRDVTLNYLGYLIHFRRAFTWDPWPVPWSGVPNSVTSNKEHSLIKHGIEPFLECSSKGDKRFSAFHARLRGRGNRSIEEIYQAAKIFQDGSTGLDWRAAKGKTAVNMDEVRSLYSTLWDEYVAENPDLLTIVLEASGVSDIFGQQGHACQATELWRIRDAALARLRVPQESVSAKRRWFVR